MTPQQVQAWIAVANSLIPAGIATVTQIRTLVQSFHKEATPEEQDQIIQGVIDDATRRRTQAEQEVATHTK